MKIAIPSESSDGLDAAVSAHFGHCPCFTLVEIGENQEPSIDILPNAGHTNGACMGPSMLLKNAGVDALMASGMKPRVLAGFQKMGIQIYFTEHARTVHEAVELLKKGKARRFELNRPDCRQGHGLVDLGHDSGKSASE